MFIKKFESLLEEKPALLFLIFIFLLPAFLPALHAYYLHTDDYFWSCWGDFSYLSIAKFMSAVGRPIASLAYYVVGKVHHMYYFNFLRCLSFLNICLLALLSFRWLRAWKVASSTAFFLSIAIYTLPAYQVYVCYLSTAFYGFASTFAMFALLFAKKAFDQRQSKETITFSVISVGLLICSFADYQPGGVFYIGMLSIPLLIAKPRTFLRDWWRPIFFYAAIMLGGVVGYYLLLKVGYRIFNPHSPVGGKYDPRAFVKDYVGRAKWFWKAPLFESSNLWQINPSVNTARLVFFLIFLGPLFDLLQLFLGERINLEDFFNFVSKWVAILALIPLSYVICLVSYDPSMEYRTYGPLMTVLLILSFFGVYFWLDSSLFKFGKKKELKLIFPILVACLGIFQSSRTITDYFVTPDGAEFRSVSLAISRFIRKNGMFSEIHVIVGPPSPSDWLIQRNEVGETTLRHMPNVGPLVRAALSEQGIHDPLIRVSVSDINNPNEWIEWIHRDGDLATFARVPAPINNSPQVLVINRTEFTQ
jgi:hypothetical protein